MAKTIRKCHPREQSRRTDGESNPKERTYIADDADVQLTCFRPANGKPQTLQAILGACVDPNLNAHGDIRNNSTASGQNMG